MSWYENKVRLNDYTVRGEGEREEGREGPDEDQTNNKCNYGTNSFVGSVTFFLWI